MSPRYAGLLVVSAALLLPAAVAADETATAAEAFKAARPKIAHALRERDPAARLAAIRQLAEHPVVDSAKLLLPNLAASDEAIRRAAFDGLVATSREKAVGEYLQQVAAKHWKQPKNTAEAMGVAAILLASESPELQAAAGEMLESAAGRSEAGRTAVIDLVDQLGASGVEHAGQALLEVAGLPRLKADFALRRAVVQALARLRTKPAVTELVKLLASSEGEVRSDIVQYLTEISGENLGNDADHWANWWQDKQATFAFPPVARPAELPRPLPFLAQPAMPMPSYYGLPITAAKIVFVIDASGSMQGPRIVAAKRELAKAVEDLPAGTSFNIIAFHTRASVWQTKLRPATDENKRSALYFLAAQTLGNKTASYDALEAALRFDAEAIYFLTDGSPTAGKIVSPPQIVAAISQQNRYRRLTIHSIGIGVNSPAFETFLATLAQQNYGQFERVDQ